MKLNLSRSWCCYLHRVIIIIVAEMMTASGHRTAISRGWGANGMAKAGETFGRTSDRVSGRSWPLRPRLLAWEIGGPDESLYGQRGVRKCIVRMRSMERSHPLRDWCSQHAGAVQLVVAGVPVSLWQAKRVRIGNVSTAVLHIESPAKSAMIR